MQILRWYSSPEWVLVIVAGITFAFVGWQAWETRRSASAALLNAKILVESQRPQIAAAAHGNPTLTLADRAAPRVQLELSNKGLTSAYHFEYESWIEVLPFPFSDFTSSADNFKSIEPMTLYPNHLPLVVNIPIRKGLTDQEFSDIKKLRVHVCIRVSATFKDAFSTRRYVNFGFFVLPDGLGFLPKYNDGN